MGRQRDTATVAANARREIRRTFEQLKLFERPRSVAVVHFAAVLDAEPIKALFSTPADAPHSNMAHRRVVEASEFAVPGIYEHCPVSEGPVASIDREVYSEAKELFDFCYTYAQVDFSFKLADRGQFRLFAARRRPRLTFVYADESADAAETALRGRELETVFTSERLDLDVKAQLQSFAALTERMRHRVTREGDRCNYSWGPDEIDLIREVAREMVKFVAHEMDQKAEVNGITFAQLRLYWGSLLALSNVHFMAHNLASNGNPSMWPFQTTVLMKSRREFVEQLSQIAGLPGQMVDTITGWYIYDPRIAGRSVIIQPFLPVHAELLCLPMLYVNGNNLERNFFKLLNRHPKLRPFASAVEDLKEPVALRELGQLFPEPIFKSKPRVMISGVTDADLLVYDEGSGFVLVIQHKWLAPPETVEESSSNDAKLSDGVRQAVNARDALRVQPELVRTALGLSESGRIGRIEAVVVCRGFEHTGFAASTVVPVITEVSFRRLLVETRGLEACWTALTSRPDLERARERVEDFRWHLKLAGFEFVMPGLTYG